MLISYLTSLKDFYVFIRIVCKGTITHIHSIYCDCLRYIIIESNCPKYLLFKPLVIIIYPHCFQIPKIKKLPILIKNPNHRSKFNPQKTAKANQTSSLIYKSKCIQTFIVLRSNKNVIVTNFRSPVMMAIKQLSDRSD